jgi:hypothetical protein
MRMITNLHIFFRYFAFFTNLSYTGGICAYFFASGVQTFAYAQDLKKDNRDSYYPLQHWPRILQYLHCLLLSTIITFRTLSQNVYLSYIKSNSQISNSHPCDDCFLDVTFISLNFFNVLLRYIRSIPFFTSDIPFIFLFF